MCNRLPEINKNGDAGIFPVYYSLKGKLYCNAVCGSLHVHFANRFSCRGLSLHRIEASSQGREGKLRGNQRVRLLPRYVVAVFY